MSTAAPHLSVEVEKEVAPVDEVQHKVQLAGSLEAVGQQAGGPPPHTVAVLHKGAGVCTVNTFIFTGCDSYIVTATLMQLSGKAHPLNPLRLQPPLRIFPNSEPRTCSAV
jgi:hypothetical protein